MSTRSIARFLADDDRRAAVSLFAFLLACYLLTYTGVIQSSDGLAMFSTAESIVRAGSTDSNQLLWMGLQQGSFGTDGNLYSRKGLGMSLLALPLVWLGRIWPSAGLVQMATLLNPVLTAWTGALVYCAGRRLGWARPLAILTALAFGLATLAWPYSQTFFSDPMTGWGLFAALYGILSYQRTRRWPYLATAGLAWGAAYLSRPVNLVTLPIFAAALAFVLSGHESLAPGSQTFRKLPRSYLRRWLAFALPIILAGILSLWWNAHRFGSLLESGYMEVERFSAPWGFGIWGLLASPGRGLIWYSPILILAIPGCILLWRRERWLAATSGATVLLYVLLYGKWFMWHGGYSWGPRFLVPVIPFLALLAGPALGSLFYVNPRVVLRRSLGVLLLAISVGLQWLGMVIPFGLVQDYLASHVEPLFAPETFTVISHSPLLLQWRFISPESIHFAWWRAAESGTSVDWMLLGPLLAALMSGAVLMGRRIASVPSEARSTERPLSRLGRAWPDAAYSLFVVMVALLLAQVRHVDAGVRATADLIQEGERSGDAILFERPAETQSFANAYHGRLPVYGLARKDPLDPEDEAWLGRLEAYRRLWVVPDQAPAHQSGWETPLRQETYLLWEGTAPGADDRRLALYARTPPEPLAQAAPGVRFRDATASPEDAAIRLVRAQFTPRAEPGDEFLLALSWECLRHIGRDYQVFVHLLDAEGHKAAQHDGQPMAWLRPTSTWQRGEVIVDRHGMILPSDLTPGSYAIVAGLYDPATGERLQADPETSGDAVVLGYLEVSG